MATAVAERSSAAPIAAATAASRRTMLDVVRLLAAYAIVWLHTPQSPDYAAATALGRFAVPFFTAAAVFLTWEGLVRQPARSGGQYTRGRLLRIYVPFLAWSAIYLAFKVVKARLLPDQPNDFPGFEVLWLGSFYHLWFMPFILATTLAVFFAGRAIVGRPVRETITLIACALAGWIIAWLPADRSSATVGFAQLAVDALPAALWGVALAIAWQKGAGPALRRSAVGLAAFVIAVALVALNVVLLRSRPVENLAGLAVLVFALADCRLPHLTRIARLGGLAYGIYLSHLLFIKALQAVASKLHLAETLPLVAGIFTLAALGSTFLSWLLARSRWTKWLVG